MYKYLTLFFAISSCACCQTDSMRDPFTFVVPHVEEKLVVQHTNVQETKEKHEIKTEWNVLKQLEDGTTIIQKPDGSIATVNMRLSK
jgi:hypothetical protein